MNSLKYEVGIKTRLKYEVGIKTMLRNKMGIKQMISLKKVRNKQKMNGYEYEVEARGGDQADKVRNKQKVETTTNLKLNLQQKGLKNKKC